MANEIELRHHKLSPLIEAIFMQKEHEKLVLHIDGLLSG